MLYNEQLHRCRYRMGGVPRVLRVVRAPRMGDHEMPVKTQWIHPYWIIASGAIGIAVVLWFVVSVVAPIVCFLKPGCAL
jgi:hypothetical protein